MPAGNKKQVEDHKSPLTFAERFTAMRNLPGFFRLVWETDARMTSVNILLRLAKSLIPVTILYIGKLIIDQAVLLSRHNGDHTYLLKLITAELLLAAISEVLTRSIYLTDGLLGDLFASYTSRKIMDHAATLDLNQFENSIFYDKLERARLQTEGRSALLSQLLSQLQDLVTMVFLSIGLIAFNLWLILILIIAVVPSFIGESHFNNKMYELTRSLTPQRREMDYLRVLGASDETAKEVKSFDLSGFIVSKFTEVSDNYYKTNRLLSLKRFKWGALFSLLGTAGYYLAYLDIILQTIHGRISIGELTFLAGSFRQMRTSLEEFLNRFNNVSQEAVFLGDFFEFLEIKPEIRQSPRQLAFPNPVKTGFVFENVGFKYTNSDKWAIRHLHFEFRPGEKLAIVGENGAGKTTLVKLLSRLYDPTEGRILLDGIDLKEYDLSELRMKVGNIFQDYIHYYMSFAHNIAVGNIKEKENRRLIVNSAQQSLADKVAEKLPQKYDQPLGRRFNDGIELSGGEWQKIALARAYIRDAQLLILDEPTASLDPRAEHEIFKHFSEITDGKFAVLISHRFSTVRIADRILVLEKGKISEMGNHDELLKRNGHYAELFNLQASGYR